MQKFALYYKGKFQAFYTTAEIENIITTGLERKDRLDFYRIKNKMGQLVHPESISQKFKHD